MNSTDSQILTGAIELLSNKGLELRVQRLELQNEYLKRALKVFFQIINEVECPTDISGEIQSLEDYLDYLDKP